MDWNITNPEQGADRGVVRCGCACNGYRPREEVVQKTDVMAC
jgi:hypothetical protein